MSQSSYRPPIHHLAFGISTLDPDDLDLPSSTPQRSSVRNFSIMASSSGMAQQISMEGSSTSTALASTSNAIAAPERQMGTLEEMIIQDITLRKMKIINCMLTSVQIYDCEVRGSTLNSCNIFVSTLKECNVSMSLLNQVKFDTMTSMSKSQIRYSTLTFRKFPPEIRDMIYVEYGKFAKPIAKESDKFKPTRSWCAINEVTIQKISLSYGARTFEHITKLEVQCANFTIKSFPQGFVENKKCKTIVLSAINPARSRPAIDDVVVTLEKHVALLLKHFTTVTTLRIHLGAFRNEINVSESSIKKWGRTDHALFLLKRSLGVDPILLSVPTHTADVWSFNAPPGEVLKWNRGGFGGMSFKELGLVEGNTRNQPGIETGPYTHHYSKTKTFPRRPPEYNHKQRHIPQTFHQLHLTNLTIHNYEIHYCTLQNCKLFNSKVNKSKISESELHEVEIGSGCDVKGCEITSSLLALRKSPPEIRDMILEYCVLNGRIFRPLPILDAIRVDGQLYPESIKTYYKTRWFVLNLNIVKRVPSISAKGILGIRRLLIGGYSVNRLSSIYTFTQDPPLVIMSLPAAEPQTYPLGNFVPHCMENAAAHLAHVVFDSPNVVTDSIVEAINLVFAVIVMVVMDNFVPAMVAMMMVVIVVGRCCHRFVCRSCIDSVDKIIEMKLTL
ncbi:hypothetical protein G7Y89_g10063 [Cudoniella acicularis]|uniref:Uncharacterized protein n=1 Tax=Cudoniella acicularis TaxID=354080 RepID=A0A8H4REI0_9HELO|nr:hypothetical protein G7Y89_g10063 [Cudoniella acicularis]